MKVFDANADGRVEGSGLRVEGPKPEARPFRALNPQPSTLNRWFAFAFAFEGAAHAQSAQPLALDRFEPEPAAASFFGVESARAASAPELGLAVHALARPLALDRAGGGRSTVPIDHTVAATVLWSAPLLSGTTATLALPAVLWMDGDGLAPAGARDAPSQPRAALGSLRAGVRATMLDGRVLRLAASLRGTLPTGDARALAGEPTPTIEPRVIVELGPLVVQGGARLRGSRAIADVAQGSEARFAAGLALPLAAGLVAVAEAQASVFGLSASAAPVEARAGLRWRGRALSAGAAAGAGVDDGVGAPAWRALADVRWSPP